MNTRIDMHLIHAQRRASEAELRELKSKLRTRWTAPMGARQRRALVLARELTGIYALLAWARGRSHLADSERSRELAEALAPRYRIEEPLRELG
ncbi:hypothetical protein G6O69_01845 [Pseudenhygromyxa sp. WMMC2535]|uniref:hypothetical protein n=1 Tax=Pseudenhygromyxa sp. WMMC2535 TaxID=2712867 RepID=UPI001551F23E|nr:hypothetical protein [Pseudenhygromyxa sp. WMMC2535]NVB36557.1 hypothetical protein [Pseudenhygromyxa sp. WMMC2535]